MRWHLPTAASSIALCKIFETKLARCHTAPENKTAVAIIRYDVIAWFRLDRDRCKCLVAHTRNMKMYVAMTIQVLFPQISVTTHQAGGYESDLTFIGMD